MAGFSVLWTAIAFLLSRPPSLGGSSLLALLAGVVVLDLGIQGAHILNQGVVYGLQPEARSRLTTAYMTCTFSGGAAGSGAAAIAWERGGWGAVSALGAGFAVLALGVWLTELR